jgi:multisubunit Na+/H+ antiporter MnhB subunit
MSRFQSLLIAALALALGGFLIWVFAGTLAHTSSPRLAALVASKLPDSGVTNPVTAVLLNFRSYDTLLELAVLLAALLGIWSLGPAAHGFEPAGLVFAAMAGWLVPVLILAAGYLLWVGAQAPGGAFQAGALLAAAGVILVLAGLPDAALPPQPLLRLLAVAGVGVFVLVGTGLMAAGKGFLTYPVGLAKWLILSIEVAATLAIGATLAAAFLQGRLPEKRRP